MSFHAFATGRFLGPNIETRCALGKGGVVAASAKCEGDGATPLGVWPLRSVLYRPDHEMPKTALASAPILPESGWCDDPRDEDFYNGPITLPYPGSAERLWRDDHVYDLIVVLGYNDDPVTPGKGSAIFLHLAQPDWRPTEGCVAIDRAAMLAVLAAAQPGDTLTILA
ncbi:MAG: L,D-transpeptidase family protein [Pseudomonadota bacterium]